MICFGILIMFCPVDPPKAPPSTYCQIARPIYWSAQDTRKTKEQADKHNAQWKAACK